MSSFLAETRTVGLVPEMHVEMARFLLCDDRIIHLKRTSGRTVSASMHRGRVCRPHKFREITGIREKAVPPHGRDDTLTGAVHRTDLGIRMWLDLIRDHPKMRDIYPGMGLAECDGRVRGICTMLKHHLVGRSV